MFSEGLSKKYRFNIILTLCRLCVFNTLALMSFPHGSARDSFFACAACYNNMLLPNHSLLHGSTVANLACVDPSLSVINDQHTLTRL
jgi:hypothetical protein